MGAVVAVAVAVVPVVAVAVASIASVVFASVVFGQTSSPTKKRFHPADRLDTVVDSSGLIDSLLVCWSVLD